MPVVLAAAVAACYAIALNGAFIFDDIHHIVDNRGIRSFATVLDAGYQETRPLFLLSLAANYAVGGLEPFGYRLVNVALHFGCVLLVYAVARRTEVRGRWFPELAAALFAVHPLATEAVTYVNSRSGVLAAFFGLLALWCYLGYVDRGSRRAYACSIAATVLAMGSKESAVVVPVLMWLYVLTFRYGGRARDALRASRSLVPHVLCIAIVPLLFVFATNPHRGTIGADTLPWASHVLTQTRVLVYFLRLMVVPAEQNLDYDFPVSAQLDGAVIASTLILAALIGVAVWQRRRVPAVAFGVAWFFVAIAPTNSLVPFKDFIAERHLYLALIGYCFAAAWGIAVVAERRRWLLAAAGVYMLALGALTVARNRVLAEPLELWTRTVEASPHKARPHVNLGVLLVEAGRVEEGAVVLRRAVELAPGDASAQFNLAVCLRRQGELADALTALRAAAAASANPTYRAELARVANNLAAGRRAAGQLDAAEALLREAIAADPTHAKALYNLATIRLARGDRGEARALLERALTVAPDYEKARSLLARLAAETGP